MGCAGSPWPPCIPRPTGGFSWKNRERDEEVAGNVRLLSSARYREENKPDFKN